MANDRHNLFQIGFLYFLSFILTATTFILGALPLKLISERLNPYFYWSLAIATFLGLILSGGFALGASFLSLSVLVGIYDHLRLKKWSLEASFLSSLTLTSFLSISFYEYHKIAMGPEWLEKIKESLGQVLGQSKALKGQDLEIVLNDIMMQIPSGIIILLSISLLLSLFFGLYSKRSEPAKFFVKRSFLKNFTLPSFMIWIFIASLLGSFIEEVYSLYEWIKPMSLNALNVILVLYFFQGLAILFTFYDSFKVGIFGRVFWTTIFILQLFLVMSIIGISDFWLNFRLRIKRKAALTKKENL